jgi:hypothetical protein
MGLDLGSFFEGGVAGIFKGIRDVIGAFKVDPTVAANNAQKLAELEIAVRQAEMTADLQIKSAQLEVDKAEAQSGDKFSSRWRPAAGWLGVIGLAYSVAGYPLLVWASANFGWKQPPPLDTNVLTTMLFGMLGLGSMRTAEKIKGVTK